MALAKQKSANVSYLRRREIRDERVRRTRSRIDAAFVDLLHRRPYGDIRISDICKKAAVGRATFYAHYAAKDDLLRSQFERRVAPMLVIVPGTPLRIDATPFFTHVQSVPKLYAALMGSSGGTAPKVLRDCFELRIRQALSPDHAAGPRPTTLSRFVAATLLTLIESWFEDGARESPVQLQRTFTILSRPAFASSGASIPRRP